MADIPRYARGQVPRRSAGTIAALSAFVFATSMVFGAILAKIDQPDDRDDALVEPQIVQQPYVSETVTTATTVPGEPALGNEWKLVSSASTDFVGNRLNRSVWDVYDSRGNAGVGWRRPYALSVENGMLRIKAANDVSGGLSQKFSQTYGRWVVRARMEKGNGYGPAILLWPDSEKWPEDGEVDFLELPKGDRSEAIMTAHWGAKNSQVSRSVPGDYTQWHTFTIDWLPDRLVFYIDGVEHFRVTQPEAIPRKPMHLALQNDVGGCDSWIGCRDSSTPDSVSLYVKSVRVYGASTRQ